MKFSALWLAVLLWSPFARAGDVRIVDSIQLKGHHDTDPQWLETYLALELPRSLSERDVVAIRAKIFTTDVFNKVDVRIVDHTLVIDVEEKWTIVPVLRGAYGGGTPLFVAGAYNTHSFGKLWTIGAETRKYGNAPFGGVLFAKAPRWIDGRYALGSELWRDFRKRNIYDDELNWVGHIDSSSWVFRGQVLVPMFEKDEFSRWQFGLNGEVRHDSPTSFEVRDEFPLAKAPPGIDLEETATVETFLAATVVYDDIDIEHLSMHGVRGIFRAGPNYSRGRSQTRLESEVFGYYLLPRELNLAGHFFVGGSESRTVQAQYFLGGLDSIRGLPDGALFGNKAYYLNLEQRLVLAKLHYVHIQQATFFDHGAAGSEWSGVRGRARSSIGVGVRFNIPQIYRMLFRIDYAWGIGPHSFRGISIGLNQFFQPYKPL